MEKKPFENLYRHLLHEYTDLDARYEHLMRAYTDLKRNYDTVIRYTVIHSNPEDSYRESFEKNT